MEEINYCVEIINLFENKEATNSCILKEIQKRNYENVTIHLDNIKLENNAILDKEKQKKNFTGYYNDNWYHTKCKKYIILLEEQIKEGNENYRYDYHCLNYVHRLQQLFINEKLDEKQMFSVLQKVDYDIAKKHLFMTLLGYMEQRKNWDEM